MTAKETLTNTASLDEFKRAFDTAAGSGLFVSFGAAVGGKFDGSGSVLRKDASWLTWQDSFPLNANLWGYVWDPKDNDELVVCGYSIDADTESREINGQFDRCGMWLGVPTQVYTLIVLFAGLFLFVVTHTFLETTSSVVVGVLTVVCLTWILWIHGRSDGERQRGKATTGKDVIQEVLREQKFVNGCPKPKNGLAWLYLVLFLAASGFGAAFVAFKQKQTTFVIVAVFFAALTVVAATIGYVKGDRQLNPLPPRCLYENEFVYLPQVKDMVTLDYLRKNSAKMPTALLYTYRPGEEWDRGLYESLLKFWDPETLVLKMTLASNDEPHTFEGLFKLSEESSLSSNHKSGPS